MESTTIISKKVELKFTVLCQVETLDKAAAARDLGVYANVDEILGNHATWFEVERQQRLFSTLLQNKEILEKLVCLEAIHGVDEASSEMTFRDDNTYELLLEISRSMDRASDVDFFASAHKRKVLAENTEHISGRFKTQVTNIEIITTDS